MEKNVTVTNADGVFIGRTYPNRAKGLVKAGRARWLGTESIILHERSNYYKQPPIRHVYDGGGISILKEILYMLNLSDGDIFGVEKEVENLINEPEKVILELEQPTADSAGAEPEQAQPESVPEPEKPKNRIYFNPRAWTMTSGELGVGSRAMVTGLDGKLVEGWELDAFHPASFTNIDTVIDVEPGTEYEFVFFAKFQKPKAWSSAEPIVGEFAQFKAANNGNDSEELTYPLTSGDISPRKIIDGWKLFALPIVTEPDAKTIRLRFSSRVVNALFMPAIDADFVKNSHKQKRVRVEIYGDCKDFNFNSDAFGETIGKAARATADAAKDAAKAAADIGIKVSEKVKREFGDKGHFGFGNHENRENQPKQSNSNTETGERFRKTRDSIINDILSELEEQQSFKDEIRDELREEMREEVLRNLRKK